MRLKSSWIQILCVTYNAHNAYMAAIHHLIQWGKVTLMIVVRWGRTVTLHYTHLMFGVIISPWTCARSSPEPPWPYTLPPWSAPACRPRHWSGTCCPTHRLTPVNVWASAEDCPAANTQNNIHKKTLRFRRKSAAADDKIKENTYFGKCFVEFGVAYLKQHLTQGQEFKNGCNYFNVDLQARPKICNAWS